MYHQHAPVLSFHSSSELFAIMLAQQCNSSAEAFEKSSNIDFLHVEMFQVFLVEIHAFQQEIMFELPIMQYSIVESKHDSNYCHLNIEFF